MVLAVDSVIQHTLSRMTARIVQKAQSGAVTNEQSGLLYLGNVHDAIPRQLYMDTRLSPLDKTAWVMIRLYAQQNDGAVFPTYEELQFQLASPHSGKASRETVSRALLMLRLTGWLSLCKRVRDDGGRVRGNIYAQHDEPLGLRDAEHFDPGWLDAVAQACQHGNKTIRLTALSVLSDIKQDTSMRHRHSRIALIESRLSSPQAPQELVSRQRAFLPGSESELSQKMASVPQILPSSETELSLETRGCDRVRNPNCYVRSYTQCVKDTYVGASGKNDNRLRWPSVLIENLTTVDRDNVEPQLQALPAPLGQQVLDEVAERIGTGEIKNVIAYLLATLKRARNGQFNSTVGAVKRVQPPKSQPLQPVGATEPVQVQSQGKNQRASAENIAQVMAEIRAAYRR
ncbi:STY4528 family pathogenicity island replication protein [Yersinia ruckeri]|uniref:STY4528 family pathogenicity island replication protein n=1 Tax=Yersinia ruckeri TaxID=29486 RepID=UPI000537FE0B|nr:STY4528 family pathogenicity island replication protein [Yersinia ruckeri]MCW6527984.1 STY4528 family pathogenicity island replication protein [Yersinia ruckeri]MCW6563156.1 STY4528 family pathogenicity island replication protein [Yersinia ruckeri]UIM97025.1 helix-turn-helix domain-containing protein [Yersinia ruckeri]UZY05096.1 STY4528 family pathogenicity island replication protein [Yersinia ruckeri]WMS06778.1 STY4528 family pathogenicity island replication protein [Yersinia ruckeri]